MFWLKKIVRKITNIFIKKILKNVKKLIESELNKSLKI